MICGEGLAWRTVCVGALLLAQIACSGDLADPSGPDEVPLGTLTATIDGVPWSGSASGFLSNSPNALTPLAIVAGSRFDGPPGTPTFLLSIGTAARRGTATVPTPSFAIGQTLAGYSTYDATGVISANWGTLGTGGSGSITITTLTATTASGSFSFTLAPFSGATVPKIISDGAFNVPLKSVLLIPPP